MKYGLSRENYNAFINEFSSQIHKHFPSVCFARYGSTFNGDAIYGDSDLDGFLIMNRGVVSNPLEVKGLAQILARALSNNPIHTQFNLFDLKTVMDGRFMSYSKDFTDFFGENAQVLSAEDYTHLMRGFHFKSGVLNSTAFNFSGPGGIRKAVLYSLYDFQNNPDLFCSNVANKVRMVAKLPKKLLWLRGEDIIPSRRKSIDKLERLLPDVDYELVDEMNDLIDERGKLREVTRDPEEAFRLLYNALCFTEEMIEEYVHKFTNLGEREVRL